MKTTMRAWGMLQAFSLLLLGSCLSCANVATSVPGAKPEVPADFTATGGSAQVTLSWSSVAGATRYSVYRSTVAGTSGTVVGTTTSAGYTDVTPANGTLYYFSVSASNAAGESALSDQVMATPSVDRAALAHGADITWVSQFEAKGATWVDPSGTAVDPVVYLKNQGLDAIRLRVMVNPGATNYLVAGTSYMLGYCDQAGVVALAQRCKAAGFTQFLIDFHFSDTWADAGHQTVPAAWVGHSVNQLATDVADHVTSVLTALKTAGITPTWVQLGNEETGGVLWGTSGTGSGKVSGTTGWSNLATLLNAGYAAVKAIDPAIQVVLHLDKGGRNSLYQWWFTNYQAAGGKWDVIGLSFYPYWQPNDTVAMLQANLNDLVTRYGKPVMIVETGGLASNPTATRTLLTTLKSVVASVPNQQGLGVFYWEPESASATIGGSYSLGTCTAVTATKLKFSTAIGALGFGP